MKTSVIVFSILAFATQLFAGVELASPFGDHMVLQRGQPVPVWGKAEPGSEILVEFAGRSARAQADANGQWSATLEAMEASFDGQELVVTNSKSGDTLRLQDVLVGEVWLCGGQSNMERQLGLRAGQKPIVGWMSEVAQANYPLIRQLYVTQSRSLVPQETVEAWWTVCSPETVENFTAVGYFFARDLHKSLQVPVGIIHSSWGGTPAEAWTSREGLSGFPGYLQQIENQIAFEKDPANAKAAYQSALDEWFADVDPGSQNRLWEPSEAKKVEWASMSLPTMWEDAGKPGFDGVGWFYKEVKLPKDMKGKSLFLELGAVDDVDTTWANGSLLGSTTGWQTPREYTIPASLTADGKLALTIRVLDTGGGGGVWNPEQPLQLSVLGEESADTLSLRGEWESYFSMKFGDGTPWPPQDLSQSPGAPTVLYNAMIEPLIPFALRGFTFYQGEANAARAAEYRTLLPVLIKDWRQRWGGELPFLFVQIAPFNGMPPEIREAQRLANRETSNTAMVVTTDVGDAEDIHPAEKGPVGERLALAARALAYGEDIVFQGPELVSVDRVEESLVLEFDNAGEGLVAPGGELYGFQIAGEDQVFVPAQAVFEGSTVTVSATGVRLPVHVRYAWEEVADGNLFNTAGLPASPFQAKAK